MQRRRFLTSLLALAGVAATAPPARALPRERRPIAIQCSPLAGFHYHEGENLWHHLQVGQPLALVREPRNPYDRRAVRIDWNGHKLGYLPRDENVAVSQMLDSGRRLTAEILALDARDYHRLTLRISLEEV
jgi:hypothetical protein